MLKSNDLGPVCFKLITAPFDATVLENKEQITSP
jgi:hypothetical protein